VTREAIGKHVSTDARALAAAESAEVIEYFEPTDFNEAGGLRVRLELDARSLGAALMLPTVGALLESGVARALAAVGKHDTRPSLLGVTFGYAGPRARRAGYRSGTEEHDAWLHDELRALLDGAECDALRARFELHDQRVVLAVPWPAPLHQAAATIAAAFARSLHVL
jgi:hypothetical protein